MWQFAFIFFADRGSLLVEARPVRAGEVEGGSKVEVFELAPVYAVEGGGLWRAGGAEEGRKRGVRRQQQQEGGEQGVDPSKHVGGSDGGGGLLPDGLDKYKSTLESAIYLGISKNGSNLLPHSSSLPKCHLDEVGQMHNLFL